MACPARPLLVCSRFFVWPLLQCAYVCVDIPFYFLNLFSILRWLQIWGHRLGTASPIMRVRSVHDLGYLPRVGFSTVINPFARRKISSDFAVREACPKTMLSDGLSLPLSPPSVVLRHTPPFRLRTGAEHVPHSAVPVPQVSGQPEAGRVGEGRRGKGAPLPVG